MSSIIATDMTRELPEIQDINPENIDSPAIRKLIEDMQEAYRPANLLYAYNRTYNRHNRGR